MQSDQISRSVVSNSLRPHESSMPGLPVHHHPWEFTQTHLHLVGDAIQPSHPLLSPSPPAPNPSQHQSLFQGVSSSHEVASFSIIPSKEIPGLVSFRMDWLDLLAVQYYPAIKKNAIMPFAVTCMDLEIIILSEIT